MKQKTRINKAVVAFRCWSRKSYAVFNSFHKVIKICTLCIAYNIIALPAHAQEQKVSDSLEIETYELGDVVITAGRTPIQALQAARLVSVISKSDIERAPAQNLNDLLRYVGGVDIRQRGPLGAQADLSIRGGTYDQTLILLNGVNITDPQTGHHNLNLPVDLESIERVEILHGPAARSFGPNAFNGAVNIITGNSKPNHIRLSAMTGQYGLYKTSVNVSNTTGDFGHFLSISHMSSDGYIENTDFSATSIFYQAKYKLSAGTIDFQSGYNKKDFGANSFYSLKYPDQFEAIKTGFLSLKYQSNTRIRFAPTLYLRRNHDRFELIRNNGSVPFNHHKTSTAGLNLNVSATHRLGETSLGIDFRNEHILSNVLGNILDNPAEVPGFENVFYTKYYNRLNTSIYAGHTVSWNMLTLTAGVMAHHNSDLKGFGIYPGIDISYRISDYLTIYSSANKTLRMPTFTDMFYKSPVQRGNPALEPEEAVSIEGGLKFDNSYMKGNISAFRRLGKNLIDWVKSPASDSVIWRSMNHTQINFTGLEGSLTFTPSQTGPLERVRSAGISYSFLQADSSRNNMLSKYSLDYLSHQVTAGIDVRIAWKLFYSGRITFQDRNGAYQDAGGQTVLYKSFWLSDMKLYWKGNHYTFYTEASNIFNTRYYDFGGIIQPGTWFRGGIVVDLDYKK